MEKKLAVLLIGIFLITFVSAVADEHSFTFKNGDYVNYSFRCFDGNGNYCESGVECMINIEYPNGTNAVDNASMEATGTSYNYVLDTSQVGEYYSMIVCDNSTTSVNSAFTYLITKSGESPGNIWQMISIVGLLLIFNIMVVYRKSKVLGGMIFIVMGVSLLIIEPFLGYAGMLIMISGILIAVLDLMPKKQTVSSGRWLPRR